MKASDHSVHFAGGTLDEHYHVCALFNGVDEGYQVLSSFIKDGLECGEKGFHLIDPVLRNDHLKRLAAAGIDVEGTIATGQLELQVWQEAYLRGDRFEQDAMLAVVDNVLQSNTTAGYRHTRIVADMGWALLDNPGVDDLLEYETRVNYVLTKYHDPVICAYDLSKFSAKMAIDVWDGGSIALCGRTVSIEFAFGCRYI